MWALGDLGFGRLRDLGNCGIAGRKGSRDPRVCIWGFGMLGSECLCRLSDLLALGFQSSHCGIKGGWFKGVRVLRSLGEP